MGNAGVPLAKTLIQVLDHMDSGAKARRLPASVLLAWRAAVGDYLAEHSRPASLQDGVLRVAVDSPALKRELQRLGPQVQARLTSVLQRRVSTVHYHLVQPPPAPKPTRHPATHGGGETEAREVALAPAMRDLIEAAENTPEGLREPLVRLLRKHAARKRGSNLRRQ